MRCQAAWKGQWVNKEPDSFGLKCHYKSIYY